jgi:protein TonB
MSKLSIYDNAWADIVFEGKNKEYGAYQLRRENPKTTLKAMLIALFLIGLIMSIPLFLSSFKNAPAVPPPTEPTVHVVAFHKKEEPQKQKTKLAEPTRTEKPKPSWQKPIITAAPNTDPEIPESNSFPVNSNPETENTAGAAPGNDGPEITGSPIAPENRPANNSPVIAVDVQPQFPGGMDNFYKYIRKNFKTPEETSISGSAMKVFVYFVIEIDGSMTDIQVLKNPGYGLDKEAIRVLKSLKIKWEPGMLKGVKVRTAYTLPITVKMD